MGLLGKLVKGRLRKKLGINKIQKSIDALDAEVGTGFTQVKAAISELSTGGGDLEEDVLDSTPGADAVGPDIDPSGLANPTFAPGTKEAAMGIYGKPIEGSFDRALPGAEASMDTEDELI